MYFSQDGCETELHVNGADVTYQVDDITEITFFEGIPSIHLRANENPDNYGNYYTTFYSGLEAYTLPEGVKAYTAKMEDCGNETVVRLTLRQHTNHKSQSVFFIFKPQQFHPVPLRLFHWKQK